MKDIFRYWRNKSFWRQIFVHAVSYLRAPFWPCCYSRTVKILILKNSGVDNAINNASTCVLKIGEVQLISAYFQVRSRSFKKTEVSFVIRTPSQIRSKRRVQLSASDPSNTLLDISAIKPSHASDKTNTTIGTRYISWALWLWCSCQRNIFR